MTLEQNLC